MLKQIEGSRAVAEAVAMCRPQVICAYPITPQTHIVEARSRWPGWPPRVACSTPIRHQVPVTDYLRIQARYAHLFKPEEKTEVIGRIQATADRNVRRFGLASLDAERAEVALSGRNEDT